MKVILQRDVPGVGIKGDIKNVADGYAQNFLLPRKLAVVATSAAVATMEKLKAQTEAEKKIADDLMAKTLKDLDGKKIVIKAKAGEAKEGKRAHLFAGIHKKEVAVFLKSELKIEIPEIYIVLEQPIKEVGSHTILIKSNTATAQFELVVEGE